MRYSGPSPLIWQQTSSASSLSEADSLFQLARIEADLLRSRTCSRPQDSNSSERVAVA